MIPGGVTSVTRWCYKSYLARLAQHQVTRGPVAVEGGALRAEVWGQGGQIDTTLNISERCSHLTEEHHSRELGFISSSPRPQVLLHHGNVQVPTPEVTSVTPQYTS